jgi:unsaturated chondroitin disaccharide hydrolase
MESTQYTFDAAAVWGRLERKTALMLRLMGDKSPHVAGQDGKYDDKRIDPVAHV